MNLSKSWQSFLNHRQVVAELATEFGSTKAAHSAIRDLLAVYPRSWSKIIERCRPQRSLKKWLFILPNNHSLVGIYPLFCAYFCRLKVKVRKPQTRFSFLNSFLEFIGNLPQAQLNYSDRKIPTAIDALLVYGSDLTVNKLRKSINKPIVAFASHDTVAVVTLNQLRQFPDLIIKDAFSLGQRGCLSVKILFVHDGLATNEDLRSLQDAFNNFWQHQLSLAQQVTIDQERLRYRDNCQAKVNDGYPLFALMTEENFVYEKIMPRCQFVLPIVTASWDWLEIMLAQEKTIKTLVTNDPVKRQLPSTVNLGYANRPCWDGTHEGRGLFCPHQ